MNTIGSLRLRAGVLDEYRDDHARRAGDDLRAGPLRCQASRPHAVAHRAARAPAARSRAHRFPAGPMRSSVGRRSRCAMLEPASSTAARSHTTCSASGSRVPGPRRGPGARTAESIRNVAYALLSGADGWMFDGEDALGQVDSMSLDNQRNLKLAFVRADVFMTAAEKVAGEMNAWARGFFGSPIITDWRSQLDFTTRIFRPRGLHLDDRHVEHASGESLSASIVDLALYVGGNHARLRSEGRSVVLYLPKIQTAEEAALWTVLLDTCEDHLGLPRGTIRVYVLVEQLEASFQLMEIRAALGLHFAGFNTDAGTTSTACRTRARGIRRS